MIDAHVHLWGSSTDNYPWREALPKGNRLRRKADPAALLAAMPQPPDGLVHVEASPADGPAAARWLAEAATQLPCPLALVAPMPMAAPDAAGRLAAETGHPGIVGIRANAAWHPDPSRGMVSAPQLLGSEDFCRTVQAAAELGLTVDLVITSFQSEAAAQLAGELPDLRLVLNHCGGPVDSGPEGRAMWRDGLERLAEQPNVHIKLSPPTILTSRTSRDWMIDVVAVCLDIFGPSRAAYGSNWPKAAISPARWTGVVADAVADLRPASQALIWSGTARGLYFEGPRRPLPAGA